MSSQPLKYLELNTGHQPKYTMIWLHGLGADGNDFTSIVPHLHLSCDCRFIFPHAPMRPITCNQGHVMRGWYDILSFDKVEQQADIAGMQASRTAIHQLIQQENARGIPTERIILGGFSQGGAIVYMIGLTYPHAFAGLISLSTYLLSETLLRQEYHRANHHTPLFIGHGTLDPIVPITLGKAAYATVRALNNSCTYQEYAIPHSVCPEEIADLSRWLNKLMKV